MAEVLGILWKVALALSVCFAGLSVFIGVKNDIRKVIEDEKLTRGGRTSVKENRKRP